MAIPDFQSIMLPLLKLCVDGREHTNQEALDRLAHEFNLSDNDSKELLPNTLST
jgi:restriction system protein